MVTYGSLFSGYGGLDMGVQAALGEGRVAWVSDIEPGPQSILAHHYPEAPNLGDVTAIDWAKVEPVDVLTGGSPCQDLSLAGARAGMKPGTRSGLWESMFTAIKTIRPRLVVWENVRGALSADAFSLMESREGRVGDRPDGPSLRALGRVLGDLASVGYDAQWCGIRASDVGAPHGRYRVFVVAYPSSRRWDTERLTAAGETQSGRTPTVNSGRDGTSVKLLPTPMANEAEKAAFSPRDDGHQKYLTNVIAGESFGHYAPAVRRWERVLGRSAPSPIRQSKTGKPQLSPMFAEWMMGLPAGWVTDVGLPRTQQLRALGNGVVPQQAAEAIRFMVNRAHALEAA